MLLILLTRWEFGRRFEMFWFYCRGGIAVHLSTVPKSITLFGPPLLLCTSFQFQLTAVSGLHLNACFKRSSNFLSNVSATKPPTLVIFMNPCALPPIANANLLKPGRRSIRKLRSGVLAHLRMRVKLNGQSLSYGIVSRENSRTQVSVSRGIWCLANGTEALFPDTSSVKLQ